MANETMNGSMQDNEACTSEHSMPSATDHSVALATYIGAFFDELIRGGVSAVVISPGSRSTPLSMMAYASDLDVYVDVDERGAAFFALGLAKATGQAVAVICTSGTITRQCSKLNLRACRCSFFRAIAPRVCSSLELPKRAISSRSSATMCVSSGTCLNRQVRPSRCAMHDK